MEELEEAYAAGRIVDEAKFEEVRRPAPAARRLALPCDAELRMARAMLAALSQAANAMLDACAVFWEGLDAERKGELYALEDNAAKFGI